MPMYGIISVTKNQVPVGLDWLEEVQEYQKDVLGLRK